MKARPPQPLPGHVSHNHWDPASCREGRQADGNFRRTGSRPPSTKLAKGTFNSAARSLLTASRMPLAMASTRPQRWGPARSENA